MNLSLPPGYVAMPAWVIDSAFHKRPPRVALLGRYNRLLSLAWNRKDKSTPALREEEFFKFLEMERRQFFEIVKEMEGMRWLRSERPRIGFVQFFFHGDDPSARNRIDHAENRTGDPIVVVVKESNDSELIKDSTTTVLNDEVSAKNRTNESELAAAETATDQPESIQKLPSVERILAHTSLLFNGAVVMSKGLDDRDPRDVLRWCAYVYSQKHTMTAPGGVVRNKLKWNEKPPEWTANKWFETLPDPFLEALGLKSPVADADDDQPGDLPKSEVVFSPLPVGSRLIASGSMDVADVAWQATKLQLEMQMTRNLYEQWVKDTQAIRYDGNALTIAAANEEAQAWLESRLTSTVERLLIGILNAEVNVAFVVAETETVNP